MHGVTGTSLLILMGSSVAVAYVAAALRAQSHQVGLQHLFC